MLRKFLLVNTAHSKNFQHRLFFSSSKKSHEYNMKQEERLTLLNKIYSPILKLDKGSQEQIKLFKSGRIWENYFHPFEWHAKDYEFQAKHINFLKEIDTLKRSTRLSAVDLLQHMTVSFTQQSCAIEGNELDVVETQKIWDLLNKDYNLDDLLKNNEISLPAPCSLSSKSENDVIEIRNHLLVTYLLYNTLFKLRHEISLNDIKRIHYIILKDTLKDKYKLEENKIQHAGEFRMVDVRAGGFHLTVYPFSIEVPALMERFIQFRNECIKNTSFHTLLIACRILSAFLHIHPFIDGNGRVGRSIMTLYLIRNGYPPNVFEQITQKEYAYALFLAQAMKEPTLLYDMITQNIFKILLKYQK